MQASKHHSHTAYKYTAVDGIKIWDIISDLWWNTFWVCENEHLLRAVILYMLCIIFMFVPCINDD